MFDYIPFPVSTHTTGMTHFDFWRPRFESRHGASYFCLLQYIQTGSRTHPAFYSGGTGSFSQPGRGVNCSTPCSDGVKDGQSYRYAKLMFSIPKCYNINTTRQSITQHFIYIQYNNIFVRTTCFDLTSSLSGPPRRQIQELYYVSLHCGIPNAYKFLLQERRYISFYLLNFLCDGLNIKIRTFSEMVVY